MMNRQLYSFIKDISFPHEPYCDRDTGEVIESITYPGYISMNWPNGSPCILVEMYLLHRSGSIKVNSFDGGTLKGNASQISHLVRYCYAINRDFWELNHEDIDLFSERLVNERDEYNQQKRNNNTIKSIISACILFLKWLQSNISLDRNIVGIDDKNTRYQIKLKLVTYNDKKGKSYKSEVFPDKLPRSITSPKQPISSDGIKLLWDALSEIRKNASCSNRLKNNFTRKQQNDHLDYMNKRREVQLYLLQNTGLRPHELVTIEVNENIEIIDDCKIIIPTAKRTKGTSLYNNREDKRIIPVERSVAIKVSVFIHKHRTDLIKRLVKTGMIYNKDFIDDYLLLNPETGKGIKPASARQDFRRIAVAAGIKTKTCQSMFRHRFITNMVKLHLSVFLDKNPIKSRNNFHESDYRTILKKVCAFTGHKDPDSLYAYIDIAWDELNVYSNAYDIKKLSDRIYSIQHSLSSLKTDLTYIKGHPNKTTVKKLNDTIDEITSMTFIHDKKND